METPTVTATKAPSTPPLAPKSKAKMRYLIGAVVLLFLVIGAIVAMYLASKSQETRQQAFEAPTTPPELARFVPKTAAPTAVPIPTPIVTSTPIPTINPADYAAIAGSVTGKICRTIVKGDGAVMFFSIDRQTVQYQAVSATDTTYTKKLPPGVYDILFLASDTTTAGYGDPQNKLIDVAVAVKENKTNIDLCTGGVKPPLGTFAQEAVTL